METELNAKDQKRFNNLIKNLGLKMKKRREELNLTQEDLDADPPLDVRTTRRLENGHVNPSLKTLWVIAKHLKLELHELLDISK